MTAPKQACHTHAALSKPPQMLSPKTIARRNTTICVYCKGCLGKRCLAISALRSGKEGLSHPEYAARCGLRELQSELFDLVVGKLLAQEDHLLLGQKQLRIGLASGWDMLVSILVRLETERCVMEGKNDMEEIHFQGTL